MTLAGARKNVAVNISKSAITRHLNGDSMDVDPEPEPEPEPCSNDEVYRRLTQGYRRVTGDRKEWVSRLNSDAIGVFEKNGEIFVVKPDLTMEGIGPMPWEDEQREHLEALREEIRECIWGRKR